MSGLAGVYHRNDEEVGQAEVRELSCSLNHRAVDGSSILREGPIGFSHQHFYTTPEAVHEELPRTGRGLTITADARIDNRDELISRLTFEDTSGVITDSDIILEAYRKWGRGALDELVGAFVFAIWDPEAGHVFCARDHMGIRPFYYSLSTDRFVFASEEGALLSRNDVPTTPDEIRIGDYLVGVHQDGERTFYSDIKRLPPATTLTITANDCTKEQYWELDPHKEIELESDEAYAEAFREHLEEAVRCRLRTNGPVGTFLSGGLDSSSVTCVANELLRKRGIRHRTFSAVFDEVPESDEREYIRRVLEECEVEATFVNCDHTGPLTDVEAMLNATDEPFTANALFLHWKLYRAVSETETNVVLGGYGGDATVSYGVGRFLQLALRGRIVTLASEISKFASVYDRSKRSAFTGYILSPIVPDFVKQAWHILRQNESQREQNPLLDDEFADRIGVYQRKEQFKNEFGIATSQRERHYRSLVGGMGAADLETADKVASAYSVDHRHPFFDKRLVEFCLALPAEQKLRHGWPRYVLRQAMKATLPPEVYHRSQKTSFGPVFRRNIRQHNESKVRDAFELYANGVGSYVELGEFEDAYESMMDDGEFLYATELWQASILAFWLNSFVGHSHDAEVSREKLS